MKSTHNERPTATFTFDQINGACDALRDYSYAIVDERVTGKPVYEFDHLKLILEALGFDGVVQV